MAIEIFDCIQGDETWHQLRRGTITASEIDTVMAQGKGSNPSLTRYKYLCRLGAERLSGESGGGFKGNWDTERGHEQEPIIRELYELRTGLTVTPVGFVKRNGIGCSPDGLVGDEGGFEAKSKDGHVHFDLLLTGKIPKEYYRQCQCCLYVTERKWWDLCFHSPKLPFKIHRVLRDEPFMREMEVAIKDFEAELANAVRVVQGMY